MNFRIVNRICTNIVGPAVVENLLPGSIEGMEIAAMLGVCRYTEGDADL